MKGGREEGREVGRERGREGGREREVGRGREGGLSPHCTATERSEITTSSCSTGPSTHYQAYCKYTESP